MENGNSVKCALHEECRANMGKILDVADGIMRVENGVEAIRRDLHHLSALQDILSVAREIKDGLMDPATGRRQIPIVSHLITVIVLGVISLALLMENTGRNIELTTSGLKIETGVEK